MSKQRKIWHLKNTDYIVSLWKTVSIDHINLLVVVKYPLNSFLSIWWRAEITGVLMRCWYPSCYITRLLTKRLSREWIKNLYRSWISLPEIKRLQSFYLNGIIGYFGNGMLVKLLIPPTLVHFPTAFSGTCYFSPTVSPLTIYNYMLLLGPNLQPM